MPRSQCSAKLTDISGHHILSPCLLAYCSGTCCVCSWVHLYLPFTSPSLERACWCENCWSACSSVKAAPWSSPCAGLHVATQRDNWKPKASGLYLGTRLHHLPSGLSAPTCSSALTFISSVPCKLIPQERLDLLEVFCLGAGWSPGDASVESPACPCSTTFTTHAWISSLPLLSPFSARH